MNHQAGGLLRSRSLAIQSIDSSLLAKFIMLTITLNIDAELLSYYIFSDSDMYNIRYTYTNSPINHCWPKNYHWISQFKLITQCAHKCFLHLSIS